jgi:hypothetical protein
MNEHTLTQLRNLRLDGMVRAMEEQATSSDASTMPLKVAQSHRGAMVCMENLLSYGSNCPGWH